MATQKVSYGDFIVLLIVLARHLRFLEPGLPAVSKLINYNSICKVTYHMILVRSPGYA